MAKKWPEKVIQRSFIKEHSFANRLYVNVFLKLTLNACSLTGFSGSDIKGQSIDTTLPLVSARVGNFPPNPIVHPAHPIKYVNRLRN